MKLGTIPIHLVSRKYAKVAKRKTTGLLYEALVTSDAHAPSL